MSNLKQIGYMITMYADDNDDWLFTYISGQAWSKLLHSSGYCKTPPSGAQYADKIFACPSIELNNNADSDGYPLISYVYGMPMTYNYRKRSGINNPCEYPMLVDSIATHTHEPYFYVYLTGSSVLRTDLRHSGTANILFLDGSVRSFDKSGLKKLGITNYYEH